MLPTFNCQVCFCLFTAGLGLCSTVHTRTAGGLRTVSMVPICICSAASCESPFPCRLLPSQLVPHYAVLHVVERFHRERPCVALTRPDTTQSQAFLFGFFRSSGTKLHLRCRSCKRPNRNMELRDMNPTVMRALLISGNGIVTANGRSLGGRRLDSRI